MKSFRVWIRSLDRSSRVRVEGIANTEWLLSCLSRSFVFKSSEPVCEEATGDCCTFKVPYDSFNSHSGLKRVLGAIPEVNVMLDPAMV